MKKEVGTYMRRLTQWKGWPADRTAIIAEVGINHVGDEALAWEMICAAHENGADFVKIQSYITEEFMHPSLPYFAEVKAMELSLDFQAELFEKARKNKIKLMTTPFDFKSMDALEGFDMPAYKVASMDNDNIPLLRYIIAKGKPVIVSCGMADLGELEGVVRISEELKNDKLVLLHCISDYPTMAEDLNLEVMETLGRAFDVPIGLSDHSIGVHSCYIAASRGAAVIEKHFTLDRSLHEKYPDADHNISIMPDELKELRRFCESVPVMTGSARRTLTKGEAEGRKTIRRGLYAKRDIKCGEELSLDNTVMLRPVKGISAGRWDDVVGRKTTSDIAKGEPILYSNMGM